MQAREKEVAARVAAIVSGHQEALLRVAADVSLCDDDAHDAVQRALEIYLKRVEQVDQTTELAWLKVVVRNEALKVRKARAAGFASESDPDAELSPARDPHERAASAERVARSAEALRRLKRDEARALIAKSMGLSYAEIGQRFGWSYTKVNRCLVEGRARFLRLYEQIETGEECLRLAPVLLDLASGVADSAALRDLRPHLRACPSCRATVRHLRGTRARRVAAALALPGRWLWERIGQVKAEAYAVATRASELSAAAPLGGGRGAAATALVGLCLGGACVAGIGGEPVRSQSPREGREERAVAAASARPDRPRARTMRVVAPAVPRPARAVPAAGPVPRPRRPAPRARGEFERDAPGEFTPPPALAEFSPPPPPAEFSPPPAPAEFAAPAASVAEFSDG